MDIEDYSFIVVIIIFIIGFIVHEGEEIIFQREWMLKNAAALSQRLPKLKRVFDHLLTLDTKAFTIAVIEESVVIALAIFLPICMQMDYPLICFGLFCAYTLHLLVHIIQGCLIRKFVPGLETSVLQTPNYGFFTYIYASIIYRHYVPGLATACILFPIFVCITSIYGSSIDADALSFVLAGLVGICFLLINLLFSHWLGKKISSLL